MQIRELLSDANTAAVVDVNARDKTGATPLIYAVQCDSADAIAALYTSGYLEMDRPDADDAAPLHYGLKEGAVIALRTLLKLGADPNLKNAAGDRPLHIAVTEGRVSDAGAAGATRYSQSLL
jgi:ankyrin repeat protein